MDSNEHLRIIRATIKQMVVEDHPVSGYARPEFIQHARDLADNVTQLDRWLEADGQLPDAWKSDDEKAQPGWQERVLAAVNEWSDGEFLMSFGFARAAVVEDDEDARLLRKYDGN
jgi:hypothetical protein